MKISIGSDHAGFEYKEYIKRLLKKEGYTFIDRGASTADSVDYPDFAHPVALQTNMPVSGLLCAGQLK